MKAYVVLEIPSDRDLLVAVVRAVQHGLASWPEERRAQVTMTVHINDAARRIAEALAVQSCWWDWEAQAGPNICPLHGQSVFLCPS